MAEKKKRTGGNLTPEEEDEAARRILDSLTPEERERLEKLSRGEVKDGIPIDLDSEDAPELKPDRGHRPANRGRHG